MKAQRATRIGRNPATGESIKIAAKRTVKFRLSKAASMLSYHRRIEEVAEADTRAPENIPTLVSRAIVSITKQMAYV